MQDHDEYFAGFEVDAATLVGTPNLREATTADDLPRQQIEAKVRAAIEADGNASVLAAYAKGNESVTACARKKTVVRACIGLLLSDHARQLTSLLPGQKLEVAADVFFSSDERLSF